MAADWVSAVAGLTAVGIAYWALRVASQTFRRDHRPIVRVVQQFPTLQTAPYPGGGTGPMHLDRVKLKNIGRGHALSVIAYNPTASAILLEVDVVEPLGGGPNEAERLGGIQRTLNAPMVMSREYTLYYQDILGAWHRTLFTPRPKKIDCSFPGSVKDSDVPAEVRSLGTVART